LYQDVLLLLEHAQVKMDGIRELLTTGALTYSETKGEAVSNHDE
jgi:hypothetical protein